MDTPTSRALRNGVVYGQKSMIPTGVRIAFWTSAILMGGAQTWYTRHRIFSDGISYLEIAQQYASGDWHGALNAYWSPLYSWIIAAYLVLFRPGPYWEVSALHVVNFAAFLGSCWILEKFLYELIKVRPNGVAGFSTRTLAIAGYLAILHGGLLMVGIGYVSPDMLAYFLTGLVAWLTARIAIKTSSALHFAALGAALGLGYLDRSTFAPLSAVWILTTVLLVRKRQDSVRLAIWCGACFILVAAPFALALTMQRGSFTLGESGKLNYGWEVNGAARSVHWQGEPGDIGKPAHPTRLILTEPVPVYEFGQPVGGSYPPWHNPAYWYEGIRPRLKFKEQTRVFAVNLYTTVLYLGTAPAFVICFLAIILRRGKGIGLMKWPPLYWALIIPAAAGIGLYCLVLVDKRYVAGSIAVLSITMLAGVPMPDGRLGKFANAGAQMAALFFLLAMAVWLRQALSMSIQDAVTGREGERNVSWMMAHRFMELGVKPGDRVAFVGTGISADWVRLVKAKVVAEVPASWDRGTMLNIVEENERNSVRFFQLDEKARDKVYEAFRSAGAVIAVASHVPGDARLDDWRPVLDPAESGQPQTGGQVLEQSPGYYHWLKR
jgi:hypothetical protein